MQRFLAQTPSAQIGCDGIPSLFSQCWSKQCPFLAAGGEAMDKQDASRWPGKFPPGLIMEVNAVDFQLVSKHSNILFRCFFS